MAEKVMRRILMIVMLMLILQVMERLDNALFSIEDPETMKSILMETRAYHRRVERFRSDMFKVRKYVSNPHIFSEITIFTNFTNLFSGCGGASSECHQTHS